MIADELIALTGGWQGTNRLWLDPNLAAEESAGTAVFQSAAQNKFATLHYTWSYKNQPQSGALLFGQDGQQVTAAWVDSWHMQDKMMQLTGTAQPDGAVMVDGSYAAPLGPDWGWRITIQPISDNQFSFIMHNISPDGEVMLAVELPLTRQASLNDCD